MRPIHLDLKKDKGLTVHWDDGRVVFYPVEYLRRMSPAADTRALRREQETNPLAVLPASVAEKLGQPLTATGIELVGHYAVRIIFSDGHDAGIFSWDYLQEIEPQPGCGCGCAGGKPIEKKSGS